MSKKFISGFISGNLMTLTSLITAGIIYKKNVIDPVEHKKDLIEDNRKKSNRKRIAR